MKDEYVKKYTFKFIARNNFVDGFIWFYELIVTKKNTKWLIILMSSKILALSEKRYKNLIHPDGEFIYILYLSTAWTKKS